MKISECLRISGSLKMLTEITVSLSYLKLTITCWEADFYFFINIWFLISTNKTIRVSESCCYTVTKWTSLVARRAGTGLWEEMAVVREGSLCHPQFRGLHPGLWVPVWIFGALLSFAWEMAAERQGRLLSWICHDCDSLAVDESTQVREGRIFQWLQWKGQGCHFEPLYREVLFSLNCLRTGTVTCRCLTGSERD